MLLVRKQHHLYALRDLFKQGDTDFLYDDAYTGRIDSSDEECSEIEEVEDQDYDSATDTE